MKGFERFVNFVMFEKFLCDPSILTEDHIRLAQHAQGPEGDILKVANRCAHDVEYLHMLPRLYTHLAEHPVTYVTRDHERAEGLPASTQGGAEGTRGYSIVSDSNKSTRELVDEFKNENKSSIVIFKPSRHVEDVCHERGWQNLNPSAALATQVENKVSQVAWLGELAHLLPEHWLGELSECNVRRPFVLQFATGHSGESTFLIEKEGDLANLIKQFPRRQVRASRFVKGSTFTNNVVVWGEKVLIGSISYQRTGEGDLTSNPFATVGNDWGKAVELLGETGRKQYEDIAEAIGAKLASQKWKGLFGLDIIRDDSTGKMYLIEINARQPASAVFESHIQKLANLPGVTTFEAHLAALLELPYQGEELIPITTGKRTVN